MVHVIYIVIIILVAWLSYKVGWFNCLDAIELEGFSDSLEERMGLVKTATITPEIWNEQDAKKAGTITEQDIRNLSNKLFEDSGKPVDSRMIVSKELYDSIIKNHPDLKNRMIVKESFPEYDKKEKRPVSKLPNCPQCNRDELYMLDSDSIHCYSCRYTRERYTSLSDAELNETVYAVGGVCMRCRKEELNKKILGDVFCKNCDT